MKHNILAAAFVITSAVSATAFPAIQNANEGIWSSPIISVLTNEERDQCDKLMKDLISAEKSLTDAIDRAQKAADAGADEFPERMEEAEWWTNLVQTIENELSGMGCP